jgi:LysM repeat protein
MFTMGHPNRGTGSSIGHSFWLLAEASVLLLVMALALGCVRAKPPRTVTVPEALGGEREIVEERAPTKSATVQVSAYPSPGTATPSATPSVPGVTPTLPPTPFPTAISASPTTDVQIPTIGPTTGPSSPTPTPPTTGETVHVVKRGETAFSIAEKYDTTVAAIMAKNNLPNPSVIYVNQELVIPVGFKPSGTPTPYTVEHVVKEGESLAQLARKYHTTLSEIITQNSHVADPNNLAPGTKLTITVGTAPAPRIHVVRPGQNLSFIARRYGVSVQALVRANGLRTPNTIYVGQKLIVPR